MRLTEWTNHDSEHSWIYRNCIQSDWSVSLILRVQYMDSFMPENEVKEFGKYCVEVLAVAPDAVSEEEKQRALDSCGFTDKPSEDELIAALVDYGIYAPLHGEVTNNKAQGVKLARQKMKELAGFTFGFAMDRPVNRIGNTGWDFISGNIGWKG